LVLNCQEISRIVVQTRAVDFDDLFQVGMEEEEDLELRIALLHLLEAVTEDEQRFGGLLDFRTC
jgi:hypothetical protein